TAESLYHDHVAAKRFGLATAWIYRRAAKGSFGATRAPDQPVKPDWQGTTLAELADLHPTEIEERRLTPIRRDERRFVFVRPRRTYDLSCHPGESPTVFTQVCESDQLFAGDLDRRRASFDKLRMRVFRRATKSVPHPELVEGRRMALQR